MGYRGEACHRVKGVKHLIRPKVKHLEKMHWNPHLCTTTAQVVPGS